jgi:hypothetical protein
MLFPGVRGSGRLCLKRRPRSTSVVVQRPQRRTNDGSTCMLINRVVRGGKVLKSELREPHWQGHARRVN